jgi:hypothetical protein
MEEKTRYLTLPIEVFNDTRLDATEKILLMRIDSFCKVGDGDGCYASNDYLASFCGCSDRKISQSISHLKEIGYIEQKSFDGRRRALWSRLADISYLPSRICDADSQNLRTEIKEISKQNIDIKGKEILKKEKVKAPTLEEVTEYVRAKGYHFSPKDFFDYYDTANWHKADGKPVLNWKQCCVTWETKRTESRSNVTRRPIIDISDPNTYANDRDEKERLNKWD